MGVAKAYFDMQRYGDQDAHGAEACEIVLRAVADGTLQKQGRFAIDGYACPSVLQVALERCSASFVQRLLHTGVPYVDVTFDDNFRSSPMHVAAVSKVGGFAKCTMLDVRDLSRYDKYGYTPLDRHLSYLFGFSAWIYGDPKRPGALCRWMMEQPECPLDTELVDLATITKEWDYRREFQQMRQNALAVRKNWTPARAAWLGAVAVLK